MENNTIDSMISKLKTKEKIDRDHWIYLLETIQNTYHKRISEIEYSISQIEKRDEEISKLKDRIKTISEELIIHNRRRNSIRQYKQEYYYNRKHINHKLKFIDKLIDEREEQSALYEIELLKKDYINKIGGKKYLLDELNKRKSKIKRYIRKREISKQNKSIWRKIWRKD